MLCQHTRVTETADVQRPGGFADGRNPDKLLKNAELVSAGMGHREALDGPGLRLTAKRQNAYFKARWTSLA